MRFLTMRLLEASRSPRRLTIALSVGVPFLFGLAAVLMPQDNNWDLRNYHWYNAYAFLTGRMGFDLGPAQTPTYYNPLLDVPFYLAAQVLPARIVAFVLGLIQGCNFILLFQLARRTLVFAGALTAILVPAAVAVIGLIGAGHIGLIGTTFYDNVLSLFFFGALLIVIRAADLIQSGPLRAALVRVFVAGGVVGLAVGLKLPAQIFAVGVCFGLLFISGPVLRRFQLSFVCGLGVIAGFAVTGGWWLARMWHMFHNPLFPYMNQIFHSPWAVAADYRDDRFLPKTVFDALTLPFRFALDSEVASENVFTDLRVAVAYGVLLLTAVVVLVSRLRPERPTTETVSTPTVARFAARYLFAAAALSYAAWLGLFAIYRYITALEMLAPLLISAAVALWPVSTRLRAGVAAALLLLVSCVIDLRDWGRAPWGPGLGGRFVDVAAPVLSNPDSALVLMFGVAPTSYVIPAFPPTVAFLRPVSYLAGLDQETAFIETIRTRVRAHTGDIFTVQPSWERHAAQENLPRLGLNPVFSACRPLVNNLDDALELCPVVRESDTPSL